MAKSRTGLCHQVSHSIYSDVIFSPKSKESCIRLSEVSLYYFVLLASLTRILEIMSSSTSTAYSKCKRKHGFNSHFTSFSHGDNTTLDSKEEIINILSFLNCRAPQLCLSKDSDPALLVYHFRYLLVEEYEMRRRLNSRGKEGKTICLPDTEAIASLYEAFEVHYGLSVPKTDDFQFWTFSEQYFRHDRVVSDMISSNDTSLTSPKSKMSHDVSHQQII